MVGTKAYSLQRVMQVFTLCIVTRIIGVHRNLALQLKVGIRFLQYWGCVLENRSKDALWREKKRGLKKTR